MKTFSVLVTICLITGCQLALFTTAHSATYYVDFAAGNDSNNGTSTNSPFRTIPGTQTLSGVPVGSAFLTGAWGAITPKNIILDNTTFYIKGGGTNSGGTVWINTTLYALGSTNLVFQPLPGWGSGPPVLDGTSVSPVIALALVQVDGVTFRGFRIQNSTLEGIEVKEKAGSGMPETNIFLADLYCYNNSTANTNLNSGQAQIDVRQGFNVIVSNCVCDGNHVLTDGILFGDTGKAVANGLVTGCVVSNHLGIAANPETGIGFKALNGAAIWSNCLSTYNLKGFDLGEADGDRVAWFKPQVMTFEVINSSSSNNYGWGLNFNSVGSAGDNGSPNDGYAVGSVNFYLINSLICSNAIDGMNNYAGPFNLFLVHNIFDRNGSGPPNPDGFQFNIGPETAVDSNTVTGYVYNNVCLRPYAGQILVKYNSPTNNFTLNCDYNWYVQRTNEYFSRWAYYMPQQLSFYYGTNGPGHAAGTWQTFYGCTNIMLATASGHFGCDLHSIGTGCGITNLPALGAGYVPLATHQGLNLSTQPWYIPDMGADRNGVRRTRWDLGPYEYVLSPPINLRVEH